VIGQVPETLMLVPGDHAAHCIYSCICTQAFEEVRAGWEVCIGAACLAETLNGRPRFCCKYLIKQCISPISRQISNAPRGDQLAAPASAGWDPGVGGLGPWRRRARRCVPTPGTVSSYPER
jgi:hypothetical protein